MFNNFGKICLYIHVQLLFFLVTLYKIILMIVYHIITFYYYFLELLLARRNCPEPLKAIEITYQYPEHAEYNQSPTKESDGVGYKTSLQRALQAEWTKRSLNLFVDGEFLTAPHVS